MVEKNAQSLARFRCRIFSEHLEFPKTEQKLVVVTAVCLKWFKEKKSLG